MDKVIHCRLPKWLAAELGQACKATGLVPADFVRMALTEWLSPLDLHGQEVEHLFKVKDYCHRKAGPVERP
jgi:hypothetical protein